MTDLRRRVAEAVGYKVVEIEPGNDLWYDELECYHRTDYMIDAEGIEWRYPDYDTDLSAITAAIEAAGYGWECGWADDLDVSKGYQAKLWQPDASQVDKSYAAWSTTADTAAGALCQALLLALGEKMP